MAGDELFPGKAVVMLCHDLNRAVKVTQIDSPSPLDGQMLFVDVEVRIHRNVAVIGVLPDNNVGSGVAGHRHAFFDSGREAGCLNDHIRAPSGGHCLDGSDSFLGGRVFNVYHGIYAKLLGQFQTVRRTADYDDVDGPGKLRQNRRIQSNRAAACLI